MLEIRARQNQGVVILDLYGRIDVDAANFIEVIGQCLRDGYYDILCNFTEIDFVDYMGISVIVIAYKEIVNNRGRMKFACVPAHIRGIFSISGLDRVIEFYATEEMGISSFTQDRIIEKIKKLQLRRRFRRIPIEIKVELKQTHAHTQQCLQAEILNLSGVGAYIYGCRDFKLGDEVILKLKLPSKKEEEIKLQARVVWLPDKQIQHQIYPGMGVEFLNISYNVQQTLLDFIEKNLSFSASD